MKVGIEGHNSLVRDTNNMAIINTDSSALEAAKRRQREAQNKENALFIMAANEKPNFLPFIFIILEAINEPNAVPTIISAVGRVAK